MNRNNIQMNWKYKPTHGYFLYNNQWYKVPIKKEKIGYRGQGIKNPNKVDSYNWVKSKRITDDNSFYNIASYEPLWSEFFRLYHEFKTDLTFFSLSEVLSQNRR